MNKKHLIIIIILIVVIAILSVATLTVFIQNNTAYQRIEIVPNATSIEIPVDNAKYLGDIDDTGIKQWTFKQGKLITLNTDEAFMAEGVNVLAGAIAFKDLKDIVSNHYDDIEKLNDTELYTIDAKHLGLSDNYTTLYVVMTGDNETHDNLIIISDNKDLTIHMYESIKWVSLNVSLPSFDSDVNIPNFMENNTALEPEDSTLDYDSDYYEDDYTDSSDSSSSKSDSDSSSSGSNVESTTDSSSGSGSSDVETTTSE